MFSCRGLRRMRIVSLLVLIFTFPSLVGLDQLMSSIAQAQASNPEYYPYELSPDERINTLARTLGYSALEVFEWVRENVDYEPYAGSVKGAAGTLRARRGNDLDQAMLLGALLNCCKAKWRLGIGDVQLSSVDLSAWLGVASWRNAAELLTRTGVRHEIDAGSVILKDHVWVEVWSDYLPVLGAAKDDILTGTVSAMPDPAEMWVALDPSVTLRQIPEKLPLAETLGVDSAQLFQYVSQQAVVDAEDDDAVSSIPARLIDSSVQRAGNALQGYLRDQNLSLTQWLRAPGRLQVEKRDGLPGNLPYEIIGTPKIVQCEPDDYLTLGTFLSGKRATLSIRLRVDGAGAIGSTQHEIALPRFGGGPLVIRFQWPEDSAPPLENQERFSLDPESPQPVIPVLELGGVRLNEHDIPVGLGMKLWLDIEREGKEESLPLLAGGHYVLSTLDALDAEEAAQVKTTLVGIHGALSDEAPMTPGQRSGALTQYLGLACHSVLTHSERFARVALAANGFRVGTDNRVALVGVEPMREGNDLTSQTLVAHLLATGATCVPRISGTQLTTERSRAENLLKLLRDLALTSAMKSLSGSDGYQSATRLMTVVNGISGARLWTLPPQANSSILDNKMPSELTSGQLRTEAGDRLRNSALVVSEPVAWREPVVGDSLTSAGWCLWDVNKPAGCGMAVTPAGNALHAWVPVGDLYPLDTVYDGGKGRYASLMVHGVEWADTMPGVTASMEVGVTAASGAIYNWLDSSPGAPHKVAIPAAAIALHGATEHFSRPQIEEVSISPLIFNSVERPGNPAQETLASRVVTSAKVDSVDYRIDDTTSTIRLYPSYSPGPAEGRSYEQDLDLQGGLYPVLADGEHRLVVKAHVGDAVSEEKSAPFTVDNTPPTVRLEQTTKTLTGTYVVRGLARDPHFASWLFEWRDGESDWTFGTSGTKEVPSMAPLGPVDTRAMDWNGNIDVRLTAWDRAGNSATTTTTYLAFNDTTPPTIILKRAAEPDPEDFEDEQTFIDTVDLHFSVSDEFPSRERNRGLKTVKLWFQSMDDPEAAPKVLIPEVTKFDDPFVFLPQPQPSIDTFKIPRKYIDEKFRLVAEATDLAGNLARAEFKLLQIGNELLDFFVWPGTFIPVDQYGQVRSAEIKAWFSSSGVPWTLSIRPEASSDVVYSWSGTGNLTREWPGVYQSSPQTVVPSGRYDVVLNYTQSGVQKTAIRNVSVAPKDSPHRPWLKRIQSVESEEQLSEYGTQVTVPVRPQVGVPTASDGSQFIATGEFPTVRITADIGASMKHYLDDESAPHNGYRNRYADEGWWVIEYKSSETFPQSRDLGNSNGLDSVTDENWHLIEWGDQYIEGEFDTFLDTKRLPEGYYDVRLWMTDGKWITQHNMFYLKVSRATETPEPGTENDIGAMTLSATDMTVPFNGYNAAVTRSYNSNDIYEPGPFGFGWRLGAIALEIEPYDQGFQEYDEAMIRLPDGRKFFFANEPPEGSSAYLTSAWSKYGEYLQRPYGMRLFRPGGSRRYHYPYAADDGISQIMPENPNAERLKLTDTPLRYARPVYDGPAGANYVAGEVAYLQTEDQTWYIFEWKTGDLLEILRPDGQQVTFTKQTEKTILVSDTSDRQLIMERENLNGDPERNVVTKITDPVGKFAEYKYDSYGNLSTVIDRSGRKRYYLYDTPQTKALYATGKFGKPRQELTGLHLHHLVDVRVDDDLSGEHCVPMFDTDTVPQSINDDNPASFLDYQDFPGDTSIMQITYDKGQVKWIETYSGGVELDHEDGKEVVRNKQTGEETEISYDGQHRVTEMLDFYNKPTRYTYSPSGGIDGVLTKEVNVLQQETHYAYQSPPGVQYGSFSDMFQAYLYSQVGWEQETMQGYLTGAQAQPKTIVQDATGIGVTTTVGYDLTAGSPSAFQPTSFTAPGASSSGALDYSDTTGKLESVKVSGKNAVDGSETVNAYYSFGVDSPDAWKTGRLMATTTYPNHDRTPDSARRTEYDYLPRSDGGEDHITTDTLSGLTSRSSYDASGMLLDSTDSRGQVSTVESDGEGRSTFHSDENGNDTYSYYNVLGQKYMERWSKARVQDDQIVNLWTYFIYDEAGRVIDTVRRKSPASATNGIGLPASDILSHTRTTYASDVTGRTETTSDTTGLASRSTYDGSGRLKLTESLDAFGGVMNWTSYDYDDLGRKEVETNNRGVTTTYTYDSLGRVVATHVTGPNGIDMLSTTGYDNAGRQEWTGQPTETGRTYTRFKYDDLGRLTHTYYDLPSATSAIGGWTSVTITAYDEKGRRAATIDEEGIATKYFYNALGQTTGTVLGYKDSAQPGILFEFSPDNRGQVGKITNPKQQTRLKFYDEKGRLKREYGHLCDQSTSSLGIARQVTEYEYYESEQVSVKREGSVSPDWGYYSGTTPVFNSPTFSRTTTYNYDPYTNQLTHEKLPDGCIVSYQYKGLGNQLSRVETKTATGVVKHWRAYDHDKRTAKISSVTSPEGLISYTYQPDGSLASIRTGSGQVNHYVYDVMGRLQQIQSTALAESGTKAVNYDYSHITGRKTSMTYPNGVTAHYSYTPRGWLAVIKYSGTATDLLQLNYLRDKRGLIITTIETRTGQATGTTTWTYTYDDLKRLITANGLGPGVSAEVNAINYGYTYDKAGNRLSQSVSEDGGVPAVTAYTYNSLDQLVHEYSPGAQSKTYAYDKHGYQISESTGTGDIRTYTWDAQNRLTGVHVNDDDTTVTFAYDSSGARIHRKLQVPDSPDEDTRYLTDSANPSGYSQTLEETDGAGVARHAYAWGGDGLLAQKTGLNGSSGSGGGGSGNTAFAHSDNLGTIKLLSNSNGGEVPGSAYSYEPFGSLTAGNEPDAGLTHYKFTGQYADSNVGMQYHRARWKNTTTGTWLGIDPVYDFPENFGNPYSYASCSPVSSRDILGTESMLSLSVSMGTMMDLVGMQITVGEAIMEGITRILTFVNIQMTVIALLTLVGTALLVSFYNDLVFALALALIPLIIKTIAGLAQNIFSAATNVVRTAGGAVNIAYGLFKMSRKPAQFVQETRSFTRLIILEAKYNHMIRGTAQGARKGSHFLTRHGMHIPDDALRQRAIDGTYPDFPSEKGSIVNSTRFNSYHLQGQAYDAAKAKYLANPNDPAPVIDLPNAGEGFAKGGTGPLTPCHRVQAVFDRDTGALKTMYPIF